MQSYQGSNDGINFFHSLCFVFDVGKSGNSLLPWLGKSQKLTDQWDSTEQRAVVNDHFSCLLSS